MSVPKRTSRLTPAKRILIILGIMAVSTFALFIWPNAVASKNLAMVQMFLKKRILPKPPYY